MRVNEDYPTWNVATQLDDPQSVHAFWTKALQLRKEYKVLIYGDFKHLTPKHEQVFAHRRSYKSHIASHLPSHEEYSGFKLVFGNYSEEQGEILNAAEVALRPYEGRVYTISNQEA
ncbi:hypothetical protein C8R45DRAFT_1113760 [Mycena sanguinolenta]|nr:hypothetical protein C8R45DRAFT_1113760 [Mycena sanguinolenta]